MRTMLVAALLLGANVALAAPPALAPDPLRFVSPGRTYTTTHTALDLDIDLEKQTVAGSVVHTVRALRPDLGEVSFNCVELTVDSVTVDGKHARFDYPVMSELSTSWMAGQEEASADDRLVVHLPTPLAREASAKIAVYYHGAPKIGLYWIQPEKGLPDKRWEVWSQGEGEDNRHWIPCNDYPNEKATFEGRFRVPKGSFALSNGAMVEKKELGKQTEFYYKLDQPQTSYLIMLAVSTYRVYETKWRDIPVQYVVPPGTDDATILRGYGKTVDMMEFFSKTTGIDYPYAKYAQVVVQDYIYGGMENTSATVMNIRTLYDERDALTHTEVNLVAHELAHQWWGDMLTCREWSHMWLNEGFATYYAYLYKEHDEGVDSFRYKMRDAQNDVINADRTDPLPMVVDFYNRKDTRNNANVYVKGASFLHMLRFLLGDALYHETIRQYGERFKFNVVETQDLMRVVKDVTGENLDWFFEQWVFLAGHPDFKVTKSWDKATGTLALTVEQTQKTGGLVPVFRVPVDIDVAWEGGSATRRVTIEEAKQTFYFSAPREPVMVLFDKDDWILKTLEFPKSTKESLHELANAPWMARVRAAEALGAKGKDAGVVSALEAVLVADGHYGLRRECALALGKIGSDDALSALEKGMSAKDGLVRLACVEAAGSFYRSNDAAALLEKALNNDPAYGVRAEALTSFGKIKTDNAAKVCLKALDSQGSDRETVRQAAINALVELHETAAIDRIKRYAMPGTRRELRHVAITGYAKLAKDLPKESDRRRASDVIASMTNDWHLRTRRTVLDALVTIGDPSAIPTLQRVASTDPLAELRDRAKTSIDRITVANAATRAAGDESATIEALKRRVEELEKEAEKVRRLEAASAHDEKAGQ
ncbi:MAG TPA: M1 family aminopeptidase [Candidatus Krumholzibacteria bacterium]